MPILQNQPVASNLIGMVTTIGMVQSVVSLSDFLIKKKYLQSDITRKMVHVVASCWLLVWPLMDPRHWTWRLNVAVPAIYSVQLVVKGLILKDRNDRDVKTMTRTGNPTELVLGPLMFTSVMISIGLNLFQREEGPYIMAVLGFGDGIAPVIGKRYGRTWYKLSGRKKSVEGSVGCFLASLFGLQVFRFVMGYPHYNFYVWTGVSLIGTLVEAASPGDFDNLTIPASIHFALPYIRNLANVIS
mmetsp:Transcript_12600/g.31002  ORF Transcript_12600/g.31002 Transcript_12600/m.31002 type:complete len:243 (-) Transcript_12600:159-887(-)